jgi:hypothetical protein
LDLIAKTRAEDAKAKERAKGKELKKKKKKFAPKKPTKDERGRLHRLKKHDVAAVPTFEKVLADKYSIKKKPAPSGAKPAAKK